MALAYTFSGGMALEAPGLVLYEGFPVMRDWLDQVAEWTGLPVERLLTEDYTAAFYAGDVSAYPDFRLVAETRQVAYAIGIADILAERGVRPDAIGGTSLGFMTGACLAGAVDRRELFDMLRFNRSLPRTEPGGAARGIAVCMTTPDDLDRYVAHPDVYLAAHIGTLRGGATGMYMLSGYVDALTELAEREPPGQLTVVRVLGGAHSPLQRFELDLKKPRLDAMTFRDPAVALYSGLTDRRLDTAEEVRMDFLMNSVQPTFMSAVIDGLARHGTELAVALGVASAVSMFEFPFPVVQVLSEADLAQLGATIHDLGIQLTFS